MCTGRWSSITSLAGQATSEHSELGGSGRDTAALNLWLPRNPAPCWSPTCDPNVLAASQPNPT